MKITWYGHSAFRLDFAGKGVLIDPFLSGNPSFDGDMAAVTAGVTHILVTHGHGDHIGDTLAIAAQTGATVVSNYDLLMWLASQGLKDFSPMNTGGTVDLGGFTVTMVRADHSAGMVEAGVGFPLGNANGFVVRAAGEPTVYAMGDTDIFGDMALIAELYEPKVGLVPIGDRFTMGARSAALACKRFFHFETVIPCHYATFGLLDASPDAFVTAMAGSPTAVVVPRKGEPISV